AAGLFGISALLRQDALFKKQIQDQKAQMTQGLELAESVRRGNLVLLLNNVLDKIDQELKTHPDRQLSDETIGRISILCDLFKPYSYQYEDTDTFTRLSPERGFLLRTLNSMQIDSASLQKIFVQSTFAYADL